MIAEIFKTHAVRASRAWPQRVYRMTVREAIPIALDLDTRLDVERRAWHILDRQLADEARGRVLLGLLAAGLLLTVAYALLSIALLACAWWLAGDAVLVDVRTDAEREWVGFVPGAVNLAWKQWPGMAMNPGFDEGLRAAVPAGKKVVLLCRSGVRSVAAAKRATELGLEAYNILEGFEGDPDAQAHRGNKGGWRMRGLPWRQG